LAIDHHDVTAANEIDALVTVNMLNSTGVQPYLYDAAGNLLFNGRHFFTYDAWNRLAAIYEVDPEDVDSNGEVIGGESAWLALECLERFAYDALGFIDAVLMASAFCRVHFLTGAALSCSLRQ